MRLVLLLPVWSAFINLAPAAVAAQPMKNKVPLGDFMTVGVSLPSMIPSVASPVVPSSSTGLPFKRSHTNDIHPREFRNADYAVSPAPSFPSLTDLEKRSARTERTQRTTRPSGSKAGAEGQQPANSRAAQLNAKSPSAGSSSGPSPLDSLSKIGAAASAPKNAPARPGAQQTANGPTGPYAATAHGIQTLGSSKDATSGVVYALPLSDLPNTPVSAPDTGSPQSSVALGAEQTAEELPGEASADAAGAEVPNSAGAVPEAQGEAGAVEAIPQEAKADVPEQNGVPDANAAVPKAESEAIPTAEAFPEEAKAGGLPAGADTVEGRTVTKNLPGDKSNKNSNVHHRSLDSATYLARLVPRGMGVNDVGSKVNPNSVVNNAPVRLPVVGHKRQLNTVTNGLNPARMHKNMGSPLTQAQETPAPVPTAAPPQAKVAAPQKTAQSQKTMKSQKTTQPKKSSTSLTGRALGDGHSANVYHVTRDLPRPVVGAIEKRQLNQATALTHLPIGKRHEVDLSTSSLLSPPPDSNGNRPDFDAREGLVNVDSNQKPDFETGKKPAPQIPAKEAARIPEVAQGKTATKGQGQGQGSTPVPAQKTVQKTEKKPQTTSAVQQKTQSSDEKKAGQQQQTKLAGPRLRRKTRVPSGQRMAIKTVPPPPPPPMRRAVGEKDTIQALTESADLKGGL
ncbi:hypothetical protein EUX98_g876 [Antrodiella citrinella]|uniref:Uncharacterized protein n=1 Tax=Antrodiella citrinella TaxID=2447956 RepID=A0A4V3XJJ7_9APHY|nr:hypothetical protein EUX98_g876 [Antrodiella citrinella]